MAIPAVREALAPAPTGAPFTILRTVERARRLHPGTADYSYAVGLITTYTLGGEEHRIAHVGHGRTYGAASQAAGSDLFVWMQQQRRAETVEVQP